MEIRRCFSLHPLNRHTAAVLRNCWRIRNKIRRNSAYVFDSWKIIPFECGEYGRPLTTYSNEGGNVSVDRTQELKWLKDKKQFFFLRPHINKIQCRSFQLEIHLALSFCPTRSTISSSPSLTTLYSRTHLLSWAIRLSLIFGFRSAPSQYQNIVGTLSWLLAVLFVPHMFCSNCTQ